MGIPYVLFNVFLPHAALQMGSPSPTKWKGEGYALILPFSQREKEKNLPAQNN